PGSLRAADRAQTHASMKYLEEESKNLAKSLHFPGFALEEPFMADRPLRLLIMGAHPDDADYAAGGTAALYRAAGHVVQMVSLTNGDAGHHVMPGPELARPRRADAAAAGAVIGAAYEPHDQHDGQLMPTRE